MSFLERWKKAKDEIFCVLFLEKIKSIFKKKETANLKEKENVEGHLTNSHGNGFRTLCTDQWRIISSETIASLMSFLVLFFLFLGYQIIIRHLYLIKQPCSQPIWHFFLVSTMVSILCCLCIFSVYWSYEFTRAQIENATDIEPIEGSVREELINWIRLWAKPYCQFYSSLIFAGLVALTLVIANNMMGPFYCVYYIPAFAFPVAFFGFQGIYWGVTTPLMVDCLRRNYTNLKIYYIYPERTPILVAMSNMFMFYAFWLVTLVTVDIIILFVLRSQIKDNGFIYPIIMSLGGYVVGIFTLLRPQIKLAEIIRKKKVSTLYEIDSKIRLASAEMNLDLACLEHINGLIDLYKSVESGPIFTPAVTSFWTKLVASIPILTTIIGANWSEILKNISALLDLG